jgi:rhamnose transport system ATP-binding protein
LTTGACGGTQPRLRPARCSASPDRLARGLSIADQQLVEIAKALTAQARVIVMDGPTAALTVSEVERLFSIVGPHRTWGSSPSLVSHRLEEVRARSVNASP